MLFLLAAVFVGQVACQLDCGEPGIVTQLEVWNLTSRTMSLRWSPPADAVAQCMRGYQMCFSAEADGFSSRCSTLPADTTQVTLTELAVCANYTIEMTTLGIDANSSAAVLSMYSGVGAIGSASALTRNITTLSVAWGYDVFTNGPCSSHFAMFVCESSGEDLTGCNNYNVPLQSTPDVLVTGLATCHQYYISLFAVDYQGRLSDPYLLPGYVDGLGLPTNISLSDESSSEVQVSWSLPQVDATCTHEPILCHVREGGEGRICQSFLTETLTNFMLSELQACASYSVQIIILTPGDYFTVSPVQHHTRAANSTLVVWVEARDVSDTQLVVAWQPVYTAPPCVLEYSVCWARPGSPSDCASVESSATLRRLSGLTPRTTYTLEVTALLTDGSRSDTATTSATTTDSSTALLGSRTNITLLLSLLLFFKNHV